jgi:hypothetical protein
MSLVSTNRSENKQTASIPKPAKYLVVLDLESAVSAIYLILGIEDDVFFWDKLINLRSY